jgi:hypothetical protein
MRYVKAGFDPDTKAFVHDPRPYQALLPGLLAELPPGAAEFAGQDGRYDRRDRRTVTNLLLGTMRLDDDVRLGLEARFEPHFATHDGGLTIRYRDVRTFAVTVDDEMSPFDKRLGHLLLDEVLPHEHGCSHEIAFELGSVTVVCGDLQARWDA